MIEILDGFDDLYESEYVKENCTDLSKGLGKIFLKNGNSLLKIDDDMKISFSNVDVYKREDLKSLFAKQVLNMQLHFTKKRPSFEKLDKDQRTIIQKTYISVIKMQKKFIVIVNS